MKPEAASIDNPSQTQVGAGLPIEAGVSIDAVQAQLEKILSSADFTRSERLSRFLRYAVEQTLQGRGERIKEHTLGIEVFDKTLSYDPRIDPIVRVEATRLRSKLKEYYATEGRDDPILIDLHKGGYVPVFHKQEHKETNSLPQEAAPIRPAPRSLRDWKMIALAAALLLAGGATYWASVLHSRNFSLQREVEAMKPPIAEREFAPVWRQFLAPETPTFVVFGSPLFFNSRQAGFFLRRHVLNDPTNFRSDDNFRLLQERVGPLEGPRYDYAEMGDTIALQRLTAFFGRRGKTLTALPAHVATWESIKDGNLIFLGAPRMNPLLRKLPVQQDFEWGADNIIYNRRPQPGEQQTYITSSHRDEITYAVIASFPGLRPNRRILLLTTHSAPGTLAAVEYVTGSESVRAMTEKLRLSIDEGAEEPDSYQMLLRIYVDKGVPVKTEYVTHHLAPHSAERR